MWLVEKCDRSFSEAAAKCGDPKVTRNVVAGLCWRAGIKAPMTRDKHERASEKVRVSQWERWDNMPDAERKQHAQRIRQGLRKAGLIHART